MLFSFFKKETQNMAVEKQIVLKSDRCVDNPVTEKFLKLAHSGTLSIPDFT